MKYVDCSQNPYFTKCTGQNALKICMLKVFDGVMDHLSLENLMKIFIPQKIKI